MSRHLAFLLVVPLWSAIGFIIPTPAQAQTPLTRGVIEALRNTVRLMPNNRTARPAQRADVMAPGDGLSTGRASLAELRFNDGSLARVGEQVVFWFVPRTRTFRLSNGTVLLLVPPGRGRTQIQTPNVTTGIQGSALFVRYNQETDTTLVGALTDSGIEVFNQDGTQRQPLRAGQMVVVVENRIERLFNFDLETFYETSDLVEGLNLNQPDIKEDGDPAIAAVQAETTQALQSQSPLGEAEVVENPDFIRLPTNFSEETQIETLERIQISPERFQGSPGESEVNPVFPESPLDRGLGSDTGRDVRSLIEPAEVQRDLDLDNLPPGLGGTPPGQGGTPPGQGGTPPGQGNGPPGLGGDGPPGLGGNLPPGQGGTPPGQGGTPPGQGNGPPGLGGNGPPGLGGNLPPGQGGAPPGQGGTPPGQGNGPPGLGGDGPPGLGGDGPPGLGGTPPGQGGTPPGQGGTPPGQGNGPPGLGGDGPPGLGGDGPPGLGGNLPPGQGGTPPGQGGTPPGLGEDGPPGLGGNLPPGQGGTPPGQGGIPPGLGEDGPPGLGGNLPPGQGGTPPGQGGTPPGQGGTPPGQGGTPPGQGGNPFSNIRLSDDPPAP